jgi:hypothetical protein
MLNFFSSTSGTIQLVEMGKEKFPTPKPQKPLNSNVHSLMKRKIILSYFETIISTSSKVTALDPILLSKRTKVFTAKSKYA